VFQGYRVAELEWVDFQWDLLLDVACEFGQTGDGRERCVPLSPAHAFHTTADCSGPMIWLWLIDGYSLIPASFA
jgi:hypothetical protein